MNGFLRVFNGFGESVFLGWKRGFFYQVFRAKFFENIARVARDSALGPRVLEVGRERRRLAKADLARIYRVFPLPLAMVHTIIRTAYVKEIT